MTTSKQYSDRLCACGCGNAVRLYENSLKQPMYVNGHNGRRLWENVDKSDGCWLWTGAVERYGYPIMQRNGKTVRVHRFIYEMFNSQIPAGMDLCHHCDTPRCVRPDHLFVGTRLDNVRDMVNKGRHCCGANHYQTPLTDQQVLDIRQKYSDGGVTYRQLGSAYRVSPSSIGQIIRRESWRHL